MKLKNNSNFFNFTVAPQVFTNNQLLGTPINTNVTLQCVIEGYPKTIAVWKHTVNNVDTVIMNG